MSNKRTANAVRNNAVTFFPIMRQFKAVYDAIFWGVKNEGTAENRIVCNPERSSCFITSFQLLFVTATLIILKHRMVKART